MLSEAMLHMPILVDRHTIADGLNAVKKRAFLDDLDNIHRHE